tara:strand:+ start:294 stop:755 length:462 start_codon:yes stop_codon:yes gene_type:complete
MLGTKYSKSSKKAFELYESIDELPVYNFWEACSMKISFLVKSGNPEKANLRDHWHKIYDEFLNLFGTSADFKIITDAQRRIGLLKCKRLIEGKKSLDAAIKFEERQLEEQMYKQVDPLSNEKQIIHLEQHYKTSIDPKVCSTKKFYTYIKMLD